MEKTIIKLGDVGTLKQNLYQHKGPTSMQNVNIDKIVVFDKIPFGKRGFKCFISYKDTKKINTLCIFLSKLTAYRKDFDETKYISVLIKDNELL